MRWDPAQLRLPRWLVRLLDALVRWQVPVGKGMRLSATRAGWVLLGTLIGVWLAAFSSGNNLLYLVGAMLLAFAVAQALAGRRLLARIDPSPLAGARLLEGHPLVLPASALAVPCEAEFRVQHEGVGARFVCDGQRACWRIECTPFRRQRIRWQKAALSTASPAGIVRWQKTIRLPGEWIVPPVSRPSEAWVPIGRAQEQFSGLRAYLIGDSPRRVHWRRSLGGPEHWVVKEFSGGPEQLEALSVDLRLHGRTREDFERLLGVAWSFLRQGMVRRLCVGQKTITLKQGELLPAARLLAEAEPEQAPPASSEGIYLSLAGHLR